jgi:ABC-type uncharacterized transport system substrate-binding protein
MRRRGFLILSAGAVTVGPPPAGGRESAVPVIGFLNAQRASDRPFLVDAFRRGLREAGYAEGTGVAIEYRWADGQPDRLPALAAELVRLGVGLIAATGGNDAALAAKVATAEIPIVFTNGDDPVKIGLVESLNRPGGNVTGVSWFVGELTAKRFEFLKELVPDLATVALLVNPRNAEFGSQAADAQKAARASGVELLTLEAGSEAEIDAAFSALERQPVDAFVVGADPFFSARAERIVAHAARLGLPAVYSDSNSVQIGGLMNYGNSIPDAYHRAGLYAGRILGGARPRDLPVDVLTKFELVINLRTAAALGLVVPLTLQVAADELIE